MINKTKKIVFKPGLLQGGKDRDKKSKMFPTKKTKQTALKFQKQNQVRTKLLIMNQ